MPIEITAKDKFLSEAELAELWGVSTRTIARWRAKVDPQYVYIPHIKIGRRIYYRVSTLERWLNQTEVWDRHGWPQPEDAPVRDWCEGPTGQIVSVVCTDT